MTHETDLIKCFQAGIDGYVSKPVDIHTLLKEMDKLMYKGDTKQRNNCPVFGMERKRH